MSPDFAPKVTIVAAYFRVRFPTLFAELFSEPPGAAYFVNLREFLESYITINIQCLSS